MMPMVAEDTVFSVLYEKFLFWGIIVGIFTFAWLLYAMIRYRASIVPDTTELDHIVVGSFPVDRHNTKIEVLFYVVPTIIVVWLVVLALASNTAVWVIPDEEEAFDMIRQFLSYLPNNVWEMPPRMENGDDPERREESLLSIIPRNKRQAYDAYKILDAVLDKESFFEITPHYGRSRIVGLARLNGYPVGVMINNPKRLGGSMDVTAGTKVMRFLQLCDTFHLPMVYLADEPGFMAGPDQQAKGIVRAGAKMLCTTLRTQMPWVSVIIRQLYGVAGQCHDRPSGMFKRTAWPSGHWGSMHISGGVSAAYRRVIDESDDPEATRKEIEAKLDGLASPFRTAESFNIEDIMDPRDTRPMLCEFVEMAQAKEEESCGKAQHRQNGCYAHHWSAMKQLVFPSPRHGFK